MIWTITPNPALDCTYQVDQVRLGESHRVHNIQVRPGGKGINVARVATQLGSQVKVSGILGGETGKRIESLLTDICPSIEQHWVWSNVNTRTSIAVVDHQATVFNEAGFPVTDEYWQQLIELITREVGDNDVVCICGSFPPETSTGTIKSLIVSAQTQGAFVIVDTSGQELVEAVEIADLVKPNEEEALAATNAATLEEAKEKLLGQGNRWLLISRGEKGLSLWTQDAENAVSSVPPTQVGNPTGAGDATVAALAVYLDRHPQVRPGNATISELQDLVDQAVAAAAAAVVMPVAGEIDLQVREEILKSKTRKSRNEC